VSTREDILNAALGVFAEHGFERGTVRDICEQAGVNVASVNYHFCDKASLYTEVLQHAYRSAGTREPMPVLDAAPDDPCGQLRLWIHWYVRRVLASGETTVGRLMAREMANPSPALDALASRAVQPVFDELGRIVLAASHGRLDARGVRLHSTSIIGQCLVYRSGAAMLERLGPPHFGPEDADAIATHVADTAIAALTTPNEAPAS